MLAIREPLLVVESEKNLCSRFFTRLCMKQVIMTLVVVGFFAVADICNNQFTEERDQPLELTSFGRAMSLDGEQSFSHSKVAMVCATVGGCLTFVMAIVGPRRCFRCLCRKQVIMVLAIVCAFLLAGIYNKEVTEELNRFKVYCKTHPQFAPLLFAGAVGCLTIVMLPTVTLFVGAGYLFPAIYREQYGNATSLTIGIVSVAGGLSIGSIIAFALGKSVFRDWAEKELAEVKVMKVVNKMVEAQGWWIVFLARMSPLMPAEIFNYVCSLTSISFAGFAFGSIGSVAPITIWIVSSAAGFDAAQAAEKKEPSGATSVDPHAGQGKLLFLAGNLLFLFVISYPMYRAFKKFEKEADSAVERMTVPSAVMEDDHQ